MDYKVKGHCATYSLLNSNRGMFATGSFDACINELKEVPLIFDHKEHLVGGEVTLIELDKTGLRMEAIINQDLPVGRDMITLIENDILIGLSIGAIYSPKDNPTEGSASGITYVRRVKTIYEVSLTPLPADHTCLLDTVEITTVKTAQYHVDRLDKILQLRSKLEVREIYNLVSEHRLNAIRLAYQER